MPSPTDPIQIPLAVDLDSRVDISSTNLSTSYEMTSYIRNGFIEENKGNNTLYVRRRGGYEAFSKDTTSYSTILGYSYSDFDKYHLSVISDGTTDVLEWRLSSANKVEYSLATTASAFYDFAYFGLGTVTRYAVFSGSANNVDTGEGNIWSFNLTTPATPTKLTNATHGIPETETLTRGIVELDNYIFVMTVDGKIYNSNLGDHLNWTSTDFLIANTAQDKKVYLAKHHDHIVAMGTDALTFYYDAGNPSGSPLALRKDMTISKGVLNSKAAGDTVFLNISEESNAPTDLSFSSDGTKVYAVDQTDDTIYQYTLSTAWDISTGSYASKSLSVASEETNPLGLAFSSDGTKAYVVGSTNDTIYQYTLSTAWDISTGSYASKSLSVTSEETNPMALSFSSDGTKAYVVGTTNDTIYQYTLSTAWDISTGSYASKSLSVAAQETGPFSLAFSSDGTKAYIAGAVNSTIYQYTLSTAWDVSTGSYASKSLSVTDSAYSGLAFSSDGTKVFGISNARDTIYQYTLSTAWDISTGYKNIFYHYTYSVGEDSDYLAFIGSSSKQTGIDTKERIHNGVYLLDNFRLKKISTDAVDNLISLELQDTTNNQLKVGIHTIEGRKVVLVGNTSLVYDIEKGRWYWWTWGTDSTFTWEAVSGEFLAKAGANIIKYSTHLTQDQDEVNTDTYLKFSHTIQTPQLSLGTSNNKFCRSTSLLGDYTTGQEDMEISWSDDNYQNFSTARAYDLQYHRDLHRCGMFRKRAWRINQDSTTTGSRYPVRLSHIEIKVDPSTVNTAD
jgi:DNA-binding beta-propeller fold protein YncE